MHVPLLCAASFQIIAISVGLVSVGVGIGIPIFYESQIDSAVSSEISGGSRVIRRL